MATGWLLPTVTVANRTLFNLANLEGTTVDYYQLLDIHRTATDVEIKSAYHQALLTWHPDKNLSDAPVDIALFKEAYSTLSSPHLRVQYDEKLSQQVNAAGPRPAQVISLEHFEEEEDDGKVNWRYHCRCGGLYRITEEDLDNGQHLVGCTSCSEVVWVGYEQVEEAE
jgi:diphthamide biosynthesis protein 4